MDTLFLLLKVALFVALVPGVLFSFPKGESFKVQAIVHGLIFAVVIHSLWVTLRERFDNPDTRVNPTCPKGYTSNKNGDCLQPSTPEVFL
jgi:hypothetical protein